MRTVARASRRLPDCREVAAALGRASIAGRARARGVAAGRRRRPDGVAYRDVVAVQLWEAEKKQKKKKKQAQKKKTKRHEKSEQRQGQWALARVQVPLAVPQFPAMQGSVTDPEVPG